MPPNPPTRVHGCGISFSDLAIIFLVVVLPIALFSFLTFNGIATTRKDSVAQDTLTVVAAQISQQTNNGSSRVSGTTSAELAAILQDTLPGFRVTLAPSTDAIHLSIVCISDDVLVATTFSDSGTCWVMLDARSTGLFYAKDPLRLGDICSAETCDPSTIAGADSISVSTIHIPVTSRSTNSIQR